MNIALHDNLSRTDRLIKALMAAVLISGVALLFFVPPDSLSFTPCGFRSLTGHSCLTCGMTRSLHAIAHGELSESVQYHLMGPAFFIVMFLSGCVLTFEAASGKRMQLDAAGRSRRKAVLLLAIVWLTYWGARLITEFMA